MSQGLRFSLGLLLLLGLAGFVLGAEALRARLWQAPDEAGLAPGQIPIYLNQRYVAAFTAQDLERLRQASFVDAEEGKTQDGWLLADLLRLYLPEEALQPGARILVSSASRDKAVDLSWGEVERRENMVLFDLSGRGTLKLVSRLESLDTREEWVQDVDRLEVTTP